MTFILSNQSRLSSLQSIFNHWIDSTVKSLRSKAVAVPTFMTTSQDEIKEPLTHENPNQTFGFFEHRGLRIHNQEDRWLKKILDNFSVQHHDDEAQEGLGTNLAM